jgi:hypothetical protein
MFVICFTCFSLALNANTPTGNIADSGLDYEHPTDVAAWPTKSHLSGSRHHRKWRSKSCAPNLLSRSALIGFIVR